MIKLTHLDKILFPQEGITKGELVNYYSKVAPLMIPYLRNHTLSMQRWPNGIQGEGFFQKNAPASFPSWIKRSSIAKKEQGITDYVIANSPATIVYLANYGCITMHSALSTITKLNFPTELIFDLDPSGKNFKDVIWAALEIRDLLKSFNLISFAKTTGSRGVHVVVPLVQRYPFEEVKKFVDACARQLVAEYPKKLTLAFHKEERGTKIFIDTLRNQYSAIAVAPYSVRARSGAPVAMPVSWQKLAKLKSSQDFTILNASRYLRHSIAAWEDFTEQACRLPIKK